jgi:hypothetical protein
MAWLALGRNKAAAFALACLALVQATAHAQDNNSLRGQALELAKAEFAKRWLIDDRDQWFLYFEVPPNPFTPVLGQQGTVKGYVEVYEITADNAAEKQINEADIANGLLWQETVTLTATRARIYDFSSGWGQWQPKVALMAITVENHNNQWSSSASYLLGFPDSATYRRPEPSELPGDTEGPRAAVPSQQSAPSCSIACPPTDAFCSDVAQKMTELNACTQGDDTNLYNRLSDAGWYYCNDKRTGPEDAVRKFEATRPPANPVEAQLDDFAVRAAVQYRCP